MVQSFLPRVPYRQLVFTIPRRLRKYFLFDRSLYGHLCRAAYASTRDFLQKLVPGGFPKLKRAVPAMVATGTATARAIGATVVRIPQFQSVQIFAKG